MARLEFLDRTQATEHEAETIREEANELETRARERLNDIVEYVEGVHAQT